MSGRPNKNAPAASGDNLWLRRAIEASGKTQVWLADELTRRLGATYNAFKISRMVRDQNISHSEMVAASEATGYPLPGEQEAADGRSLVLRAHDELSSHPDLAQKLVEETLRLLLIAKERERTSKDG